MGAFFLTGLRRKASPMWHLLWSCRSLNSSVAGRLWLRTRQCPWTLEVRGSLRKDTCQGRCRFRSSPTRSAQPWGLCTSKSAKRRPSTRASALWAPNYNRWPPEPVRCFSGRRAESRFSSTVGAAACVQAAWIGSSARPTSPLRCEGGYKACRAVFNQVLSAPRPYVVLGGMTGCAKTEVLGALRDQGEAVLDLEGLAKHYGSAFGNLDEHAQPSTEHFTNLLASALMALDEQAASSAVPIWVENESRQIGRVHLPEMFHKGLREAPVLELERSEEDRVAHLLSMYGDASKEALIGAFERIRTKLGGQHTQAAIEHVQAGDLASAAKIALVYYDKTYRHSLDRRDHMRTVDGSGQNPHDTAHECRRVHNEWNPWNLLQMSN